MATTDWQLNPMRFMQLALATTMAFSVVYMVQFVSLSVQEPSAAGGFGVAGFTASVRNRLLGKTQYVVQGFEEGYKFVSEYDPETQGPLYILFMSDANENGTYWCPDCEKAKKPIYDAFNRAPRGSRIVEIRIGPESYWADDMNDFKQNQLFYIDYIPTLMRYDGGGNSSAMLNERYCLDEELLDFVFRVPRPSGAKPANNAIMTLKTPDDIVDYVDNFDGSHPLFIFFVSGFHSFNGRLWCPYCDRADVAVMHYYNTTAPANAMMIRAVVAETYKKWKKKKNPFKRPEFRQKIANVRGVPYLARVTREKGAAAAKVTEFLPDFDAKDQLQLFYKQNSRYIVQACQYPLLPSHKECHYTEVISFVEGLGNPIPSEINQPPQIARVSLGLSSQFDTGNKMGEKHRDRRHGPAPASPWKLLLGAIGLLYVLFVVRVNLWTDETQANAISGIRSNNNNNVHAKGAAIIHNDRDLRDNNAKTTTMPPKPQLRSPPEKPTMTPASAAEDTTAPPAYLDAIKSTLTSIPEKKAAETKAPLQVKRNPPGGGDGAAKAALVDAQAPTEAAKKTQIAGADEDAELTTLEEEKAAHDHEAEPNNGEAEAEAPIHLAVAVTPVPVASEQVAAATPSPLSFEARHDVISGYEQTKEYLQNYKRDPSISEGEGLFLFFTCSDDDGNPHDWSTTCVEARKKVYDIFAKSPTGNRLLTIRAGSEEFWEYRNDFSNDRDLRVKSVPCVMKWEGKNGETSGMMIGSSLLYEPFLRYLFKNIDKADPYLKPDAIHKKHIITLSSREEYDAYMSAYRREGTHAPLYLFFVSGRIADNKRPWCPYCRFSEIPSEYSFYAFAPTNARLVRIEVTKTYKEWKQPNPFNTDPVLGLRGVPAFFRILPAAVEGSDDIVYQRIIERFDLMETWQRIYAGVI